MENRLDFLRTSLLPRLEKALPTMKVPASIRLPQDGEPGSAAEVVFDYVIALDPDPTKKNSQWLLNTLIKGGWLLEDAYKVREYLPDYLRLRAQLPVEQRDINRFKTLPDLYDAIEPLLAVPEVKSNRQVDRELDAQMHEQAQVIYNAADYKIVVPLTKAASQHFGVNTKWCTAATNTPDPDVDHDELEFEDENMFDDYNARGDLFIILDKKSNTRWQFHLEDQAFMDERDKPISLKAFMQVHSKIASIFADLDGKPVGRIASYNVYRNRRGLILKKQPGLGGEVGGTIFLGSDNKIGQMDLRGVGEHPTELASLLNSLHVIGDPKGDATIWGNLYYRDGKWGTVAEIGAPFLECENGYVWKIAFTRGQQRYALVNDKGEKQIDAVSNHGILNWSCDYADDEETILNPGVSILAPYLTDLIVQAKGVLYSSRLNKDYAFEMFPEQLQKRILAQKPSFAPVKVSFPLIGVTYGIRGAIENTLNEMKTHCRRPQRWIEGSLVVEQFFSIGEMLELCGDTNTRALVPFLTEEVKGDFWINDFPPDRAQLAKVIASLSVKQRKRLDAFLIADGADAATRESAEGIAAYFGDHKNDGIVDVGNSALDAGWRSRQRKIVIRHITAQLRANPVFHAFANGEIMPGVVMKVPYIFAVPAAEVVRVSDKTLSRLKDWLSWTNSTIRTKKSLEKREIDLDVAAHRLVLLLGS